MRVRRLSCHAREKAIHRRKWNGEKMENQLCHRRNIGLHRAAVYSSRKSQLKKLDDMSARFEIRLVESVRLDWLQSSKSANFELIAIVITFRPFLTETRICSHQMNNSFASHSLMQHATLTMLLIKPFRICFHRRTQIVRNITAIYSRRFATQKATPGNWPELPKCTNERCWISASRSMAVRNSMRMQLISITTRFCRRNTWSWLPNCRVVWHIASFPTARTTCASTWSIDRSMGRATI